MSLMPRVRVFVAVGLLWSLSAGPSVWAQTTPEPTPSAPPQTAPAVPAAPVPPAEVAVFKVNNYPVLTLKGEGANARVQKATATLKSILDSAALPPGAVGVPVVTKPPEVKAAGDDAKSQILVNGQVILELTPQDNPQSTVALLSLTQVWATKMQQIFNRPNKNSELAFQGLPEVLNYRGKNYVRVPEVTPDRGTFTTDGSRSSNLVLFWIKKDGDPPSQVYVLNRFRQFIPYTRTGG
jgi:antitoxin (DNA-binding transcriptional repressor) of toxin-antitoxin stability system